LDHLTPYNEAKKFPAQWLGIFKN